MIDRVTQGDYGQIERFSRSAPAPVVPAPSPPAEGPPADYEQIQRFSRGGSGQPVNVLAPRSNPPTVAAPQTSFAAPASMPDITWSEYQETIFREVAQGRDSVVVCARAGSAKTTSILEATRRLDRFGNRVLFLAFNKRIEQELAGRAPPRVMVKTTHAFGLWQYMRNSAFHGVTRKGGGSAIDKTKAREIAEEAVLRIFGVSKADRAKFYPLRRMTLDMLDKLREQLVPVDAEAEAIELCLHFGLNNNVDPAQVARAGLWALAESARQCHRIDFGDMVWFPHHFDYGVTPGTVVDQYDVVFVDEAQDLAPVQVALLYRVIKPGGRIVAVGDEKQAIYLWRGANSETLNQIQERFSAKRLTLPISYRCPRKVVELAQQTVPDIQVAPGAKDGVVEEVGYGKLLDEVQPGHFLLSRTNAPLARTCLRLIRRGKTATISGLDVGESLKELLRESKARSLEALEGWLADFIDQERVRHKDRHPRRVEYQEDRVDTLLYIAREAGGVAACERKLDEMFSDEARLPDNVIVCSTIHKAKGLEREQVWLLKGSFLFNALRGALLGAQRKGADDEARRIEERIEEEHNIWYVGVTRAKDRLMIVDTPVKEITDWDRVTSPDTADEGADDPKAEVLRLPPPEDDRGPPRSRKKNSGDG